MVLLTVLTALIALMPPANAATITVNTVDDELNTDGDCSLREAIEAANINEEVDACAAGSATESDTVNVPAGTYNLSMGHLSLSSDMEVVGVGPTSTVVDANDTSRVLAVGAATVGLSGLTITDGSGGGIYNNNGALTITNVIVSDNTGSFGGGSGIYNDSEGTVTLINSTVSGNTSPPGFGAGGILNAATSMTIVNSTISGNSADGNGGGILGGNLTLVNSTVSGNSAGGNGGAIFGANLDLTHSTVTGNTAGGTAGGIYVVVGPATLTGTILANSISGGDCGGSGLSSGGYNLVEAPDSCFAADGTDIVGEEPVLGPLADNGGPTLTHALLDGSPAIDSANPACPPPATDQRGVDRPQGPICDIGAFELEQVGADLAVSVTDAPDPVPSNQNVTYAAVVTNNGDSGANGVTLVDTTTSAGKVRSATTTQGACTLNARRGRVTCALGSLAGDASATVEIVVRAGRTRIGTITNRAQVSANEPDPDAANNSDSENTTIAPA